MGHKTYFIVEPSSAKPRDSKFFWTKNTQHQVTKVFCVFRILKFGLVFGLDSGREHFRYIWQSPFEIKHRLELWWLWRHRMLKWVNKHIQIKSKSYGLELRFFNFHETFFELTSTICLSSRVLIFFQKKLFVGFILISKIP
jgi:hypothetical protein